MRSLSSILFRSPSPLHPEPLPGRRRGFHFWRFFWLLFLVVSLPYAWYCFYVPANKIAWANDFDSAQKQATASGKPIILYFTGKWCVPCRIMKRQVWADNEVAELVNSQFIPIAIDLDDPKDAVLLHRYNVRGAPVTLIADEVGNALRWRAGGIDKSEFLELLRSQSPATGKDP